MSRLCANNEFVLRQCVLYSDCEGDILTRTLRSFESSSRAKALTVEKQSKRSPYVSKDIRRAYDLQKKIAPIDGQPNRYKICQFRRQKYEQELDRILGMNKDVDVSYLFHQLSLDESRDKDIHDCNNSVKQEWTESIQWLTEFGFLDKSVPTITGYVGSVFMDGLPLLRAKILSEHFPDLDFHDIVCWLAIFAEKVPMNSDVVIEQSEDLAWLISHTTKTAREMGIDKFKMTPSNADIMSVWVSDRKITTICQHVSEYHHGSFAKMVNRVYVFIEEIQKAAMHLERYDLYNELEGALGKLYHGIITNASLYVSV